MSKITPLAQALGDRFTPVAPGLIGSGSSCAGIDRAVEARLQAA